MESPLVVVIIVLIIVIIYAFWRLKQYAEFQKLHNLVVWCIITKMDTYSHSMPLWSYISNAQIKLSIPEKYRISGEVEWKTVKDILSEFQKDLAKEYFFGNLKIPKSKYVIPGEDYFVFALQSFLGEHQCDYEFLGHNMHKERISYEEYGSWGALHFDATYSLTEFAVVYHKLYYIAYCFCKDGKIFNPKGNAFQNSASIKHILDTKQIQISRY